MQITKLEAKPLFEKRKRVAAYARVSTGKDAMLHSLAQQVDYYSDMIRREPGWSFAGVYADEAYTGTKDSRPDFQRLLSDCRNGKIDLIVTKSISRFARNTVTLLETTRELKALGIDVYFEEQRIHTISADGELMLSFLASYAQEESKSASDNQKWRIRKGFARGELMCFRLMFGYRISRKNGIEIDPERAPIVCQIFQSALQGKSLNSIAKELNHSTCRGALDGKWNASRIRAVLSNEKYTGNAVLQKTYINNHLEKKKTVNHGQVPRYYATGTHPAIIDKETFNQVQEVLKHISEKHQRKKPPSHLAFTGMIICPTCGKKYRHILNHGRSRWACQTYIMDGKEYCQSKAIPDETLKQICCELFGWDSFDESSLHSTVDRITALYPNGLVFHLKDGTKRETEWHHNTRANSWTPEMKKQAAENARRKYGNNSNKDS